MLVLICASQTMGGRSDNSPISAATASPADFHIVISTLVFSSLVDFPNIKIYKDIVPITFLLPNTKLTQEHIFHHKLLLQEAKAKPRILASYLGEDKTVNLKYFTLPLDSKFPSQIFFFRLAHPFLSTFSLAMIKVEEKPSQANSQ